MKLDYGTQLSPVPVKLSIGSIKKPTLREIAELSFDKFSFYEMMLKLTPELYYENMCSPEDKEWWESMPQSERDKVNIFDVVIKNEKLYTIFLEVFNYFFEETIIFREGYFIILKDDVEITGELKPEDIKKHVKFAISSASFQDVLNIIQQVCGIYDGEGEEPKFKNNRARRMFEKMKKGQKKEKKKVDKNLTLPNIISALCNKHPSLNYTNIWELTVFQLIDAFNRTQINSVYDIESTRVSVWGDEKKTFDASLWFKNNFDTN